MNPELTPCGRCGHTLHGGGQSDAPCCAFPGCDCAGWKRPQCPGSLGVAVPGACPGRPFVGGHDAECPDVERSQAPRISYSIDPSASLVRLLYWGAPSFDEWRRTMEAVFADPAYRPGFCFLQDRRLDEPASPEYVRRVIHFLWLHAANLAGSRWAIVVRNPASYGMARVTKALGFDLPVPIEVFMNVEEAERWLRSGGDT